MDNKNRHLSGAPILGLINGILIYPEEVEAPENIINVHERELMYGIIVSDVIDRYNQRILDELGTGQYLFAEDIRGLPDSPWEQLTPEVKRNIIDNVRDAFDDCEFFYQDVIDAGIDATEEQQKCHSH